MSCNGGQYQVGSAGDCEPERAIESAGLKEFKTTGKVFRVVNFDETLCAFEYLDLQSRHVPKAQCPEIRCFQKTFPGAPKQRVKPLRIQTIGAGASANPASLAVGESLKIEFRNSLSWSLKIQRTNSRSAE